MLKEINVVYFLSVFRGKEWKLERNEPSQNFPVFRFYPIFPRFFKFRKCERCGSLNPRLQPNSIFCQKLTNIIRSFITSIIVCFYIYKTERLKTTAIYIYICLLYTSPSPRDGLLSRMPSSA